jgi:hypothetical protein
MALANTTTKAANPMWGPTFIRTKTYAKRNSHVSPGGSGDRWTPLPRYQGVPVATTSARAGRSRDFDLIAKTCFALKGQRLGSTASTVLRWSLTLSSTFKRRAHCHEFHCTKKCRRSRAVSTKCQLSLGVSHLVLGQFPFTSGMPQGEWSRQAPNGPNLTLVSYERIFHTNPVSTVRCCPHRRRALHTFSVRPGSGPSFAAYQRVVHPGALFPASSGGRIRDLYCRSASGQ